MRKSSKGGKGSPKLEQAPANEGVDDVKSKAVNEMMERIKHGVVLRPVKGQDTKRFGTKQPSPASEEKHQESAMEELKGILDTVKKSPSRGFQETLPVKKDSELEVILRRRRKQACDPAAADEMDGQISKVSSNDSLNGRHSSDSGKDTDGPGSSSLSTSDTGSRSSTDSGKEPSTVRRSSDSGTEPSGTKPRASVQRSLSEKRPAELVNNKSPCNRVPKNGEEEKSEQPNGISHPTHNEDLQASLSSSADGPNDANGSVDAEC